MKRKGGLGKGLSLLIGEGTSYSDNEAYINNSEWDNVYKEKIIELNVDNIIVGKYQPRKVFDEEKIDELMVSISHNGVMVPILVRKNDKNNLYELIAGERRLRAVKKLKKNTIPAIIKDLNPKEAQEYSLVENIQREDLNPIEESEGYLKLIEEFSYTQEQLANIVGKSRSHIANLLRILSLDTSIKLLLSENKISLGHAKLLIGTDNALELANLVYKDSLSVRQLENIIKTRKNKNKGNHNKSYNPKIFPKEEEEFADKYNDDILNMEKSISEILGMKVKIQEAEGGGRVAIYFDSLSQLDIILQKLTDDSKI